MTLKLPKAPYETAKAIYAGRSMLRFVRSKTFDGATASTEGVFTLAEHGLAVGNTLRFKSGTDGSGLTADEIYYVTEVPTDSTFKLSATHSGAAVTIDTAYTDVVFAKAHCFGLKKVTLKGDLQVDNYQEPDETGVLRTVDQREKSNEETSEFESPETLRKLELFDGKMFGQIEGTVTIFAPDPQRQKAGTIALVSEEDFPCTLASSGDTELGEGFSKAPLKLTSLKCGGIIWQTAVQILTA